MRLNVCGVLILLVVYAQGCCEKGCNQRGTCTTGTCTCNCFSQFYGADCSLRKCPLGKQWVGSVSATDTVHTTDVECSGVGSCSRSDGICKCQDGFEGLACERMSCPAKCNSNGRCVSLKDAATERDDRNFFRVLTYATEWDASRIYGCQCDVGFEGYDCSRRTCPKGDDPKTTGQVDEVQVLECTCSATCSGNVYLSFRGHITSAISFDANAATIKAALEALPTIHTVTVAFTGGTAFCDADGVSTAVTFTHDPGDVPQIRVHYNGLATTGATKTVVLWHSGQSSSHSVASVVGTKENIICNGRGTCDYSTGLCTCYTGYASSDKLGASGTSGDCGYVSGSPTACPGSSSCSGHGVCSGASAYTCTCYDGYTGADCATRVCPLGKAWFDEAGESLPGYVSVSNSATAVTTTTDLRPHINRGDTIVINGYSLTVSTTTSDTFSSSTLTLSSAYSGTTVAYAEAYGRPEIVHHMKECSGQGLCDSTYGTCSCAAGFTGNACQRTKCPSDCSGRGTCISLEEFAITTESNGDATSYTYGTDPSKTSTWDYDMLFGCKCDTSLMTGGMYDYSGHDCSKISCPTGDDPSTSGVHEKQTITCDATGGSFTVTFRQKTTEAITFSDTAATVKTKLEALDTIGSVTVAFASGVAACASGGIAIAVTFTHELGDLPLMTTTTSLTGGGGTAAVAETTKGTMENAECSLHGLCDTSNGMCKCFSGYVSSDGSGNAGTRSDCGFRDALFAGS